MDSSLAGDVDAVGLGEDGRIVVGGADVEQHEVAGADPDAVALQVGAGIAGHPATAFARRTKDFFDGVRDEAGLVVQGVPLTRVGQQEQRAHADLDHGRLVAAEQQRHGEHGGLLGGDAVGCAQA
ncbi:hypothetical protein SK571_43600 [Lentzea sp. BCCO 10_0798]|uniref:Uncharacterized protein n=1 Tax=Lentzea kristufekii TaxID=3095430 RepID=A0ABU4U6V5_9PSEU|nr:hypothetical protein [Lentzea sp. BCCO 10_0798]MDX8056303.1 hypothetical protein [Lentzea sp. BCCO 10_0798]